MKLVAVASGILVTLFGLFVFHISMDMMFEGEELPTAVALTYLLFVIFAGLLPYVLGIFFCYWGLNREKIGGSVLRAFLSLPLSFNGRISRGKWWLMILVLWPLYGVVDSQRQDIIATPSGVLQGSVLSVVFLSIVWPMLAIQVKRWHDQDRSAFWVLLNLIPFIGSLISLIMLGGVRGTEGENRFGDDPLETQSPVLAAESALGESSS